ncbi:hypothetical protein DERF_000092 [Dermatophagoides farinae]|nr:hypothetical protein DERF_000092 [Dermatophagoides farinae]
MHGGGGGHDPHHSLPSAKRVRLGPGGMGQGPPPNTSLFGNNGTNSQSGKGGGHQYNQRY